MKNIQQKPIDKIEFLREWVFIIGMVFILPFVYTKTTIDPVLSLRFFILSILLLVISFLEIFIFIRKGNNLVIQKRIIWMPLLFYLFFSVLSLTNAGNVYEGVPQIVKILMFMTVFFISSSIFNSENSFLYFIRSTIISAILLSFIGVVQYYFNYRDIPGGYGWPYGTMANGNLFASALFLFLSCHLFTQKQPLIQSSAWDFLFFLSYCWWYHFWRFLFL